MLALGTRAPQFELPDVASGKTVSLETFKDAQGLLVMFISRHCPYVQLVKEELARIGRDYPGRGLGIVAVSASAVASHPDDAPGWLREMADQLGFAVPVC